MARPLNKAIREHIEDSVVAATYIPAKKAVIIDSAKAAAREALRKTLPEGFEAAIAHLPVRWFDNCDEAYMVDAVNPAEILYYSRDESLMKSHHGGQSHYLHFDKFPVPYQARPFLRSRQDKDNPDPTWDVVLAAQISEAEKLHKEECTLREELRAVLYSVTSVEKLLEKMPNLERHVPPAVRKAMPLVVSTAKATSLLKRAGFDTAVKA